MNYNFISNAIMCGEKLTNLKLRVCFYARVSTESDVQLNSLDNQLSYYENFIKSNNNWTYIKGYIDEGISGVRVDKRNGFKQMILDAKDHKFDLIITKEVSRFARDLEDSIHYIRELKSSGVGIYFENQNLNTFDEGSELILNIMFNIAQEESRKLSKRIKFGHHEAIKKGHVLGSSNIIGYQKDNCKLVIVKKEAELIKNIYNLYSTGEYGLYKLSKKLSELGYLNKNNHLFDKDTLKRIIENPKYKGFYCGKTIETIDYRTKKRKKINKNEQVIYKSEDNTVPAIVSEEIWNKANEILKIRSKKYNNNYSFSGGLKYPLSSKIYCKEHNICFQRSHGSKKKNRPIWSCSNYLKYGKHICLSPIILEKDLYNIMLDIMKNTIPNKDIIIKNMLKLYQNINETNKYDLEVKEIDKDIKTIEDKKSMTLDLVFSGKLKKDELKVQFNNFESTLKALNIKRKKIIEQINILNQTKSNIKIIAKSIQEELNSDLLMEFIRNFVDKIIVSKINNDRYNIKLDIYLNLYKKDITKANNITPYLSYKKHSTSIENKNLNKYIYYTYIIE